ncbi:MAG TPA: Clp protease N-terminal domain-containing protein [Acidimicrobiales bacterium]|jgi:ATP-dependent Clp protease ATP-binding subunit ClpA|nr:Clp protease N-terminal domain-containing protein [Acidimicrobiales bacterium]
MFERLTDRARRVLVLAQEEARLLDHEFIGTEHLLLGLIAEGDGIAANVLTSFGIGLDVARRQVQGILGPSGRHMQGSPPFTPSAKKVLELSLREALQMGHSYIGTEHLLLALIREDQGGGVQVLVGFGVDLASVRQRVIHLLPGPAESGPPRATFSPAARRVLSAVRHLAPADPVGTHHFLLALFDQEGSLGAKVLSAAGLERSTVQRLIDQIGTAGARKVEVSVQDDEVVIGVRDAQVAAMLQAALGNEPSAADYGHIWAAIAGAASDLERQARNAASTEPAPIGTSEMSLPEES